MPYSEKQRRLACMALQMSKGRLPHSANKAAHSMMTTMSQKQLEDFCHSEVKE